MQKRLLIAILSLLSLILFCSLAFAAPVMSSFKPDKHGFMFENSFHNDVVPQLNVRTTGLCGGMSYAVLDYFWQHAAVPNQGYRPASGTVLQRYLYARQVDSILPNVDKWAEYTFNPDGMRNMEFFNWGLIGNGKIAELRSFLDKGKPVVLGLIASATTSHQVVAIGYDLGRYKGDLGQYKQDFKIYVYDPNHPGKVMTLVPRLSDFTYTYAEDDTKRWRSYFVDGKYAPRIAPFLPNPTYPGDGKIREIILEFYTGADDLRGGNDNINVFLKLKSNLLQIFNNVNLGARWLSNYDETVRIVLQQPVAPDQVDHLLITSTFGGGISGDNWNMAKMIVHGVGGNYNQILGRYGYKRFSGRDTLIVPLKQPPVVPAGYIDHVRARFETLGNDLRGGNDNLNINIFYKDGYIQTINNVNGSATWPNGSVKYEELTLNKIVRPEDIVKVSLTSTFGNDINGGKWDMKSLELRAFGNGVNVKIGSLPYVRFVGVMTLNVPTRPSP
jgi:hypothetical protein